MPLILEILTERDLEAYASGRLDDVERASVEQCARHDRRVAARLRSRRPQQPGKVCLPEPAGGLQHKPNAARRPSR
jgi:anti-sigma factor RsiW